MEGGIIFGGDFLETARVMTLEVLLLFNVQQRYLEDTGTNR